MSWELPGSLTDPSIPDWKTTAATTRESNMCLCSLPTALTPFLRVFSRSGAAFYLSPGSPDPSLIQESVPPSLRNQFHLRKPKTLLISQNYSSSVLNSLRNPGLKQYFNCLLIFSLNISSLFHGHNFYLSN